MITTKINFDILTNSKVKLNIHIIEKKINIYFTVCCINNYIEIFENIIEYIYANNDFFHLINEIRLVIFNSSEDLLLQKYYSHPKIKVIKRYSENFGNTTEYYTLNLLRENCIKEEEDFYVLYLHTKGVSDRHQNKETQLKINSWVNYLLYFNINYYKYILSNIDNYSVIGVDLNGNNCNNYYKNFKNLNELVEKEGLMGPNYPYCYGGNFWWSKSDYIKNISECEDIYPASEFFITNGNKGKFGKFLSLYNSKNDFYKENYSTDKYIGKELKEYVYSN